MPDERSHRCEAPFGSNPNGVGVNMSTAPPAITPMNPIHAYVFESAEAEHRRQECSGRCEDSNESRHHIGGASGTEITTAEPERNK